MKITDIYDSLGRHRRTRTVSLVLVTLVLAGLVLTLRFSENITDFLPFGTVEREHMSVYQNISGAERMVMLFSVPSGTDRTVEAVDAFVEAVREADSEGWCGDLTYQFDTDDISEVSDFVYDNIPYFLTPEDYVRMDSLLSVPGYVGDRVAADRDMLMFPSPFVSQAVTADPLSLFSPVMSRLQTSAGQLAFEMVDGYIFTPDLSRAVAMMNSPFGSSETENNSRLLKLLEGAAARMNGDFPDVTVDIIGGPAIAVGNSHRIKTDSFIAVSLSVILIILLLIYSFNSARNILLIFLSVGWGLLFALGGMALLGDSVSIIVIGISSVILGIAVNYPLHLVAQVVQQPDRRAALKEIVSPLVVGNITTVGAFLALIPLKSTALRDLGIFASLLLAGTILFVLIYLPHLIEVKKPAERQSRLLGFLSKVRLEESRVLMFAVVAVTAVLALFSFRTGFDSDISNINYMTRSQREDMQYFEDLLTRDTTHTARTLYVMGEGAGFDAALAGMAPKVPKIDSMVSKGLAVPQNQAAGFIVSREEQESRLGLWKDFVAGHRKELTTELASAASRSGFAPTAFSRFSSIVEAAGTLEPQGFGFFEPLTTTVFTQNFTEMEDTGKAYAVCALNVEPENVDAVKACFGDDCFDVSEMSNALSNSLSDNFNYIGWACSLIVFLFLWFSFGRLELALISFLPMAVSWVWILGLMGLLGIKFNIVNIILATFIFGQGDDYTIFITEGCQYEYARRRTILPAYKSSILESAAIMFVGIGTLIVAKHPAMRSLAEVTIIGMFSVVLMACFIPPFLFRWFTTRKGERRRYPVTLRSIFLGVPDEPRAQVLGRYIYKGKEIERSVRKSLKRSPGALLAAVPAEGSFELTDEGYGETAILLALTHPAVHFTAGIADAERLRIAAIAAEGFVDNLEIKSI